MLKVSRVFAAVTVAAGIAVGSSAAYAGPFILAGTDADDHGSASGSTNLDGWFFMQRSIENLAPSVTNGSKVVVSLGSSSTALAAKQSAFNLSGLVGQGWTFQALDGAAAINSFFANTGAVTAANSGIVMLDSGNNVSGGLDNTEEGALTANATQLNSFLGAGGGLFSQANSYGFLSALVPGLTAPAESNTGINLTAAGSAAFPGLTNADLSAGPYHNQFANIGSISVLGVSTATTNPIIIGASGGSITDPGPGPGPGPGPSPTPVPEPASMLLLASGLLGAGLMRRKS